MASIEAAAAVGDGTRGGRKEGFGFRVSSWSHTPSSVVSPKFDPCSLSTKHLQKGFESSPLRGHTETANTACQLPSNCRGAQYDRGVSYCVLWL